MHLAGDTSGLTASPRTTVPSARIRPYRRSRHPPRRSCPQAADASSCHSASDFPTRLLVELVISEARKCDRPQTPMGRSSRLALSALHRFTRAARQVPKPATARLLMPPMTAEVDNAGARVDDLSFLPEGSTARSSAHPGAWRTHRRQLAAMTQLTGSLDLLFGRSSLPDKLPDPPWRSPSRYVRGIEPPCRSRPRRPLPRRRRSKVGPGHPDQGTRGPRQGRSS